MPKTIVSPIRRWEGTIVLADPLTLPQVAMIERAIVSVQQINDPTQGEKERALLPAVLACVERVQLKGLPESLGVENWPGSPRVQSSQLFGWLLDEIMNIYAGETDDPLA